MKKNNSTCTFYIKHTLDTGEHVEGQFTTKRLTVKDRSRQGVYRSQISGNMYCVRDDFGRPTGQGIDEDTDMLNSMISLLEISLIQKPDWWDLEQIEDMGLLGKVYDKVLTHENSFFRPNRTEDAGPGQVGQGNGDPQSEVLRTGNSPTPVNDGEVQTSLDA